jgi:predicted CoA-substrate-specific enzyme activase
MFYAGIDAGSRAVKVVVIDGDSRELIASGEIDQGIDQAKQARDLFASVLQDNNISVAEIGATVATGYARNLIAADRKVTEITCHARGARHLFPAAKTIIEIGGQDSKVIRLGEDGRIADFKMNDRCAAGTGRFLEAVAVKLETSLARIDLLCNARTEPVKISSTCVVFAESEIIGLLASGAAPSAIVAGVLDAIARRVATLAGNDVEAPVVFTGGVARVAGMAGALAQALGKEVTPLPCPSLTGALGAALLASD